MSRILHSHFCSKLSLMLAILMIWPSIALAATGTEKPAVKSIVISDRPDDYKISMGKAEGAQVGAKGVISRDGKDIAKFEITSVSWGYSRIAVTEVEPGARVRLNDSVRITEQPRTSGEQKVKKKDGGLKALGAILLIGAVIALGSSGGGKGGGGTASGGTVGDISLSSDRTSMPADGASTAAITATVVDRNNAAVRDGTAVRFSASAGAINPREATTVGGTATATLTAGTTPGLCTVTATAGGKSDSVTISFLDSGVGRPGSIQLTANPSTIQVLGSIGGTTESAITATCRDAQGDLATSGNVTFSSTIGSINGSAPINASGVATATFTSSQIGEANITASWERAQSTTTVRVTSGPPYTIIPDCTPGAIQNDGHSFATVTATVKDISGNPVTDGTLVQFAVQADVQGGGNGTITPEARTSNGVAQAILLSRDEDGNIALSGTATVVVTVPVAQPAGIPTPAVDLVNDRTQVQFTSLDAAEIRLGANPINICGLNVCKNRTTIMVMVYDANHNPVPDRTAVYFTSDYGLIFGNSGMAGDVALSITHLGNATAILESDCQCPSLPCSFNGLVTVRATSGPVSGTCNVIFSGWSSPSHCSATISNDTLYDCKDNAVITVVALDINDNPVVDGTTVTFKTSKGTLDASTVQTKGGVVTATLSTATDCSTGSTATGPGTVTITIDSCGYNPETGGQPVKLTVPFTVIASP